MTDPNDLSTQLVAPGAGSAPRKEIRRSVLRKIAGRTVPTQVEQVQNAKGEPCLLIVERLSRDAGLGDEQAATLVRVARALAALQHPNVVRGRAVSVRSDEIVVATDYVDGETLSELWRALAAVGSSLPPDIAIRVLVDVLSGLEALHGFSDAKGSPLGLIHGEVTASNVLIGREGKAMLLHASRIRRPGVPSVSDPGALAPEIAAGAPADRRADVFSVGVLLWQALSGVPALIDATDADLVTRIRAGTVERAPAPRGVRWGAALVDIAKRAMAPSAKDRYESAAAMAADLRKAIGDELPATERVAQYLKANMGDKNDAVQKPSVETPPATGPLTGENKVVTGAHRVALDKPATSSTAANEAPKPPIAVGPAKAVVAPKAPAAPVGPTARNVPPAPPPSPNIKVPAPPQSAAASATKRTAPTPALGSRVLAPSAPMPPATAPKPPLAPASITAPKPPLAPVPSITAPKPPAPTPQVTAPKPPPAPTPALGIRPAAQVSRAPAPPAPKSLSKTIIGGVTAPAPVQPALKPPPAPAARPATPAKPSTTPAVAAPAPAPAEPKQPPTRMATLIGPVSPHAETPAPKPPSAPLGSKPVAPAGASITRSAPTPDPRTLAPKRKDLEPEVPTRKPPPKTTEAVAVSSVLEIDGSEAHSVPPPPPDEAPYPTFPRIPAAATAVGFTPPVSEHPVPQEPKVVIAAPSNAGTEIVLDRDSAPPSSSGAPTPRLAKSVVDEPTVLLPRTRLEDLNPGASLESRARRNRAIVGTVAAGCLLIVVLAGLQLKRKGEPARAVAPTATTEAPAPHRESPPPTPPVQSPPANPTAAAAAVATPPADPAPAVVPETPPAIAPEPAPRATHVPASESPSFATGTKTSPAPASPSLRPPKPAVDIAPPSEPAPPPPRPKFDPKRI